MQLVAAISSSSLAACVWCTSSHAPQPSDRGGWSTSLLRRRRQRYYVKQRRAPSAAAAVTAAVSLRVAPSRGHQLAAPTSWRVGDGLLTPADVVVWSDEVVNKHSGGLSTTACGVVVVVWPTVHKATSGLISSTLVVNKRVNTGGDVLGHPSNPREHVSAHASYIVKKK